jgi:hypothetical protein
MTVDEALFVADERLTAHAHVAFKILAAEVRRLREVAAGMRAELESERRLLDVQSKELERLTEQYVAVVEIARCI